MLQTCRPKLSDEQKSQLRTCFDLMDADGSGAIDADELQEAFELLGLNYSRAKIQVCCCVLCSLQVPSTSSLSIMEIEQGLLSGAA
jgi:Ca2+-binding EF-hand superfamily protein